MTTDHESNLIAHYGDHTVTYEGLDNETETQKDIWALLEESAPEGCEAIQDLYSWSLNYDAGKGPFTLYLDLVGWTFDQLGDDSEPLYRLTASSLGYIELDKLAAALTAYAEHPAIVGEYVVMLMDAESAS